MVRKVRGRIGIFLVPIQGMPPTRDSKLQKKFGERVRALRLQRGISQEELAHAADLDRTYIGGVERGERNISLLNIHTIARALAVPVMELFSE